MSQTTLKSKIVETRTIDRNVFALVSTDEWGTTEWHEVVRNTDRRHKSILTRPLRQYLVEWQNAMAQCGDNDAIDSAQDNGWDSAIAGGYAAAFGESLETEAIACMFAMLTLKLGY